VIARDRKKQKPLPLINTDNTDRHKAGNAETHGMTWDDPRGEVPSQIAFHSGTKCRENCTFFPTLASNWRAANCVENSPGLENS
jgi:hypothetical protein